MQYITELYNKYLNSDKLCVVLGCGESAKQYIKSSSTFSIGVNDIGLHVDPDILMLVDSKQKFERDSINKNIHRVSTIESVKSEYYVVTDNTWNFDENKKYLFKLGKYCRSEDILNIDNTSCIDYAHDSPFMAVILAYKLGFRNIAILGVDYTQNHFYKEDGDHQLVQLNYQSKIESAYNILNIFMKKHNAMLYNLSEKSIINCIKKISLSDFYKLNK